MNKLFLGLSAVLLGLVLAAPAVNADSEITMGNGVVSRGNLDTYAAFAIIDTNNPADYTGTITSFSYYAANTNPFKLMLVDNTNKVRWLSDYINPNTTGALTYTPSTAVAVEKDWNLGVYFPATSTIPYDTTGTLAKYTSAGTSEPTANSTTLAVSTANRTYSISAVGDAKIKPGTTEFIYPANNSTTTINTSVTFKWEAASTTAPTSYQFQYFKNNAEYTGNADYSVMTDLTERTASFTSAGTYYLRVRAKDGNDEYSDWSNNKDDKYKLTVGSGSGTSMGNTTTTAATSTLAIKDVLAKKLECMKGNWNKDGITGGPFKNQGQCVAHYNQMIMGHIQDLINQIVKLHQQLQSEVKKQNDIAKEKGYSNWGQYVKAKKEGKAN